jgi:hypothetical protein
VSHKSLISDLHETHFADATSQAMAALHAVPEVKVALAAEAPMPTGCQYQRGQKEFSRNGLSIDDLVCAARCCAAA